MCVDCVVCVWGLVVVVDVELVGFGIEVGDHFVCFQWRWMAVWVDDVVADYHVGFCERVVGGFFVVCFLGGVGEVVDLFVFVVVD